MIKLIKIKENLYKDYRNEVIFNSYKWDPQVADHNTISEYVLVIDNQTATFLEEMAEKLSLETIEMEKELVKKPKLVKQLGLPKKIEKELLKIENYQEENHIRLMRFDFHPTKEGWKISEVNSDVPGGYAEASTLPEIASKYFLNLKPRLNFGSILLDAFKRKIPEGGNVGLIYATSYVDDRQVMQFFGDLLKKSNRKPYYLAPDNIKWINDTPYSNLDNNEKLDGFLRFFPFEWLCSLPRYAKWRNLLKTDVASCNHPIAMLTQSKRLPLVWDMLDANKDTWKMLLPKTIDPKKVKFEKGDFIYKPALGRVGDGITIKGVMPEKELKKVMQAVKKYPKDWVAQEKFESQELLTPDGAKMHLCIGVFTVNGKRAGFYGRISPYPRIDSHAKDIPILVLEDE